MKRILFFAGLIMTLMAVSCEKEKEVAVNSSSILGDWEITSRVWEYIEDGVVDSEADGLEETYVFTLASDGSCAVKVNGTVLSTSRWTLTGKKIVFAETTPEPDIM